MPKETPKLTVIQGGKKDEPVISTSTPKPLNLPPAKTDYVRDVFGSKGYLSKKIKGYRPRMGQVAMAKSIDAVIRGGKHLIVEGPTGTGKSFAYAVPAAYHAAHNGMKVCIVTANKTLQRQIYDKDLAMLQEAVPWKFSYSIRKGMGNYLCLRDFAKGNYHRLKDPEMSQDDEVLLEQTVDWAKMTKTGDYDDSPGIDKESWLEFSTNGEGCDGKLCNWKDDCFARSAKDKGNAASLVVTNYHLLFLQMMLPDIPILPSFDVIILDEAHRATKIARDFFGDEITYGSINNCISRLSGLQVSSLKKRGNSLHTKAKRELDQLWSSLEARAVKKDLILHEGWTIDSMVLEQLLGQAATLYNRAGEAISPRSESSHSVARSKNDAEAIVLKRLAERCTKKQEALFDFRAGDTKGNVYFIDATKNERKKRVTLGSKMVDVSAIMHHRLFKPHRTVIQTSATIAIKNRGGSDFDYLKNEMGMKGLKVAEKTVQSPFDYRQSILVVPEDMPTYAHGNEDWEKSVCKHFELIIDMMGGKTLGLFTSYRMMHMVREYLRKRTSYTIYSQGEGTNRDLSRKFQDEVDSVLLGTESFSEGVSIEGDACSCVILDKVPFIPQTDPIVLGMEKKFREEGQKKGKSFQSYILPEAIISMKQRVGRLIRTETDTGVAVILDNRLHEKQYGRQFLQSVAFDKMHKSVKVIPIFMRRLRST